MPAGALLHLLRLNKSISNMIKVISRAPNDQYTFDLFYNLTKTVSASFEAYYVWSNTPEKFKKIINDTVFTKPNVIIGIKDVLDCRKEFDYLTDIANLGAVLLVEMACRNPDKNFVVFTSLENLTVEFNLLSAPKNLQIIEWGGDITNQSALYPAVAPVLDKNFSSSKLFISLNRHPRTHRLVLLSYLIGANYHNNGHITYIGDTCFGWHPCIPERMNWIFEERHNSARESILSGYDSFYKNFKPSDDKYELIYPTPNDNVYNFTTKLTPLYQNSLVEFVGETSFLSPSFLITEKFLNSVYGCNFPILVSGLGSVAHLRNIGFDMFDDIIDHGYDLLPHPFDRIIAAVDDNKKLLVDNDYVKNLWRINRPRFEHNINVARTKMYEWYTNRAIEQFNRVKWLDK
jgi:hypothetical protein